MNFPFVFEDDIVAVVLCEVMLGIFALHCVELEQSSGDMWGVGWVTSNELMSA